MPSPSASLRRTAIAAAATGASLIGISGCAVPTEPRWDRADTAVDSAAEASSPTSGSSPVVRAADRAADRAEPTTRLIEEAPVTAAVTMSSRVLPATETVVVAPTAGRIGNILTSTGSDVAEGEPIIEWVQDAGEVSEAVVLRREILERQIRLAEIEGRTDAAAAAAAELQQLQDRIAPETTVLKAPADGVLGRFIAQRSNDYVAGEPLFTVGDPAAVRVDLELGVDEFADIVVGTELRVIDAQNRFAEPAAAVVVTIEPVATPSDAPVDTAPTRIVSAVLADESTLVVGERVLVDVDRSSGATSRRVRADAVLDDGRGPFLLVADESGWHRVDIEIGVASGEYLEVLADIDVGTVVVVP